MDSPKFRSYSLNELYPTPKRRIENPIPTFFQVGDLVRILTGPATGKIGQVVVERNANYEDKEPYSADEDIAVSAVEPTQIDPFLRGLITSSGSVIDSEDAFTETAVRWFDTPDQLELILRSQTDSDVNSSSSER
jgi:hypothetical protein